MKNYILNVLHLLRLKTIGKNLEEGKNL